MNEAFLHTVWKHKLLRQSKFKGTKNEAIEVLSIGEHNQDSGPDFFNSKVRIDGLVLVGNVELHINTSDWIKHKHQFDKAYDNLVLHVVYEHDLNIDQNEKQNVSVLELKPYLKPELINQYNVLQNSTQIIPCGRSIQRVSELVWNSWMERLAIDRIENKTDYIEHLFSYSKHHFEETLYLVLCRNFGFKINSDAFELLGKNLPLGILKKYANNRLQVEALLYGTAGLLDDVFADDYPRLLQNEFEFLKQKHQLIPIKKELWKFSKTRPVNFATIRLSQFAELICNKKSLFHLIEERATIETLKNFFTIETSEYWWIHYRFDEKTESKRKPLGDLAFSNIIINTIVPFLFFLAKHTVNQNYSDYGLELLSKLEPENNTKTKHFFNIGIRNQNALESQAQIWLYDQFCSKKACLHCRVAQDLLKNS